MESNDGQHNVIPCNMNQHWWNSVVRPRHRQIEVVASLAKPNVDQPQFHAELSIDRCRRVGFRLHRRVQRR